MIHYFSLKQHEHYPTCTDISEMKMRLDALYDVAKRHHKSCIAMDIETTGLDTLVCIPLLIALGNEQTQIVIDVTTVDPLEILPADFLMFRYIAHNAKFDYSVIRNSYNVNLNMLYCTMIADQCIYQNVTTFEFNYYAVRQRHLNISHTVTNEGESFVGVDPSKFIPRVGQIEYVADDIKYLVPIKEKQVLLLKEYNMLRYVVTVEFPLIKVLAKMELTGVGTDDQKWTQNTYDTEQELYELQCLLDKTLRKERDKLAPHQRIMLVGGAYDAHRNFRPTTRQVNLFGGSDIVKQKASAGNVNWNSNKQLIEIFAKLGFPAPTQDGKCLYPILNEDGTVPSGVGENDDGDEVGHTGWTTADKNIDRFIIENPQAESVEILELVSKHSKLLKAISTYGHTFIQHKNPFTNRIHTVYRQKSTANGRLSSGGGKKLKNKPNLQNIPRLNKYRNCFVARPGYVIQTIDLTGAEVVIICDKARDQKLYELAVVKDDAHSPIITNSWRHVYLYRACKIAGLIDEYNPDKTSEEQYMEKWKYYVKHFPVNDNDDANFYYEMFKSFTVSKQENKPFRQAGKNCTFGSIYNMKAKTAAATYNGTTKELRKIEPDAQAVNVTFDEAEIALWAIKQFIPKTFEWTQEASNFAFANGYLVLNKRSYSRAWFLPVIKILQACRMTIEEVKEDTGKEPYVTSIKKGWYNLSSGDSFKLDWKDVKDIDGQARNLPISGTQADLIKESMVVADSIIEKHKDQLDLTLLLQVHDELVYEIPENYDDITVNIEDKRNGIKIVNRPLKEVAPTIMTIVANKYLEHVKMKCDYDIKPYWTK